MIIRRSEGGEYYERGGGFEDCEDRVEGGGGVVRIPISLRELNLGFGG